jgi:hypothetical protein
MSEQLQSVIDKRNTRNEKNAQTQRERNTAADMDETRADGDDDDEVGYSEDDHGEDEDGAGSGGDGTASHSKRRQDRSIQWMLGPHTHRDNPLCQIMCAPIAPPVTVCHTVKIGLLFCFFIKTIFYPSCKNGEEE